MSCPPPQGEMAELDYDRAMQQAEESEPSQIMDCFHCELSRRGEGAG